MTNKRNFLFLFLLAFLGNISIFGQSDFQPGFIIRNAGDTVSGFIDYRGKDFNAKKCVFKSVQDLPAKEFFPGEIKAYGIVGDKKYVSKKVAIDSIERVVFLEQLVDGVADLYYYPPKIFFIETEERGIQELENTVEMVTLQDPSLPRTARGYQYFEKENNEYIGYLKIYFQDQFSFAKEIDKIQFEANDLINITTKYHNLVCPDEQCIVYQSRGWSIQKKIGLSVGTEIADLKLYRRDLFADPILETNGTGYFVSFNYDMFMKGNFERTFSSIDASYSNLDIRHTSAAPYYSLSLQSLNLSISFLYIYPPNKLKPFIGLGIGFQQTFANSESFLWADSNIFDPRRRSYGLIPSFGAIYQSDSRISFKFKGDYYKDLISNAADTNLFSRYNRINLSLGILYNLYKGEY